MSDEIRLFLGCPRCLRHDTLYENVQVPGWRDLHPVPVDPDLLAPIGLDSSTWRRNAKYHSRDNGVEWHDADFESYGCSCGEDEYFTVRDLVIVDEHGVRWPREPPQLNPDQLRL